jgi:hypothetical protein
MIFQLHKKPAKRVRETEINLSRKLDMKWAEIT